MKGKIHYYEKHHESIIVIKQYIITQFHIYYSHKVH